MGMMNTVMIIIIVQSFFSLGMTGFAYTLPAEMSTQVNAMSDFNHNVDLNSTSVMLEEQLNSQSEIPLKDVGALVFYSGNVLLDLILNFVFAIPEMIGLLFTGISMMFAIDAVIANYVQLFASILIIAWYVISILQMLTSIRSGNDIT